MKKIEQRILCFIILMAFFCAIMIFGLLLGPKYPRIFFWGLITFLVGIVGIFVTPTLKDFLLLIGGMILLGYAGELASLFFTPDTLGGFIGTCIAITPVAFPLGFHFSKMCVKCKQQKIK